MTKLTLTDLANLQNEATVISTLAANNAATKTALENTLSRDGTSPNNMLADMDMNSHKILNLPDPASNTEPVTLGYATTQYGTSLTNSQNAAASANAAAASASSASSSASSASSSASSASTSASNASTSATNAATSETNAATSAANAATSAGVIGAKWTFDSSTTMSQPTAGNLRFNNVTISSVTSIAVSAQDAESGNPDVSDYVVTWDDSTNTVKGFIVIRKLGTPSTFAIFTVSAVSDNTTWLQITVAYVASSGTWTASDSMVVGFTRAGDKGLTGAGTGDMLAANNLSDVASYLTSLRNLHVEGGVAKGDTTYTIQATDKFVYTNAAFTASRAWTLPAANSVNAGRELIIADVAAGVTGTNTLVVTRAGTDTIENGTTLTLNKNYAFVRLVSDGVSKWKIIGINNAPIVTTYTSGSGTHTTTPGVRAMRVRMVGGGGGSAGAGAGQTNGGAGGNTTFGTLTASGGGLGSTSGASGAPGTGTGGDLNITGTIGAPAKSPNFDGGSGGGTPFGPGAPGGGGGGNNPGQAGSAGTGGGAGGATNVSVGTTGGGGSGGGYLEKTFSLPAATYAYSVGAGGSAGAGAQVGAVGGSGIISVVEEF